MDPNIEIDQSDILADNSNRRVATRQSRWESLVSELEGVCDFDDETALGISARQDGEDFESTFEGGDYIGSTGIEGQPFPSTPSNHSQRQPHSEAAAADCGKGIALDDWIANNYQSLETTVVETAGRKKYFEKSVKLLYSVVKMIVGCHVRGRKDVGVDDIFIHPILIESTNITVHEITLMGSAEVTADFVECGDSALCMGDMDKARRRFEAMEAVGRIAHKLFMLGQESSMLEFCSKAPNASRIDDEETEENHGQEDDIIDMLWKRSHTTTSGEDSSHIVSAMLNFGVPYPLCRFVSDLMGDGDRTSSRSEYSFSSLMDVLSDLQQMSENPDLFVHASSPGISFGGKLYGRDEETQILIDAADRVAITRSDPMFEQPLALAGRKKEFVLVSGNSGSGKSQLVRSVGAHLEKRGWLFLHSKFDPVAHPEPLSVLAFALEEYLGSIARSPKHEKEISDNSLPSIVTPKPSSSDLQRALEAIRQNLERIVGLDGLAILTKHIPSIHRIVKLPKPEKAAMEVNETVMHTLFGQLLQALSSGGTPILFFFDDLQWADELSLAMLFALVKGARPDLLHLSTADTNTAGSQVEIENDAKVMFVGSYRDDEIGDGHELAKALCKVRSENLINVTKITLSGLSFDALNDMLAELLGLPLRRVRSLSELIITKTDGQPLHVIEFIGALTKENLLSHSFTTGWQWDEDSIAIFPITESVAELLAFKLRRLPENICRGLQIISCFGSQVDRRVLGLMAGYHGENSVDIPMAIDVALGEGLIEQADNLIRFSHDTIQRAVYDSINGDALIPLFRKLTAAVIKNASAVGELDSVLFVAVDLINRIGSDAASSPKGGVLFAELNLRAGVKAMSVPDFASAATYAENGISFLSKNHWETQYDLSLSLHDVSVSSQFSSPILCSSNRLRRRIQAVLENAKNYSDKFTSHNASIKLLAKENDLPQAIEEGLRALEQLGEPLDLALVDRNRVISEFMNLKEQFPGENKENSLLRHRLTDSNKTRAMIIMSSLMLYYQQQQSLVLAMFVSCEMIKLSIDFGHCKESMKAISALAISLIHVMEDVEEASAWARTALSLMNLYGKGNLIPYVSGAVYGSVLFWKEPLQSTLEPLAKGIKLSLLLGSVEDAVLNTFHYTIKSFLGGKNISILIEEIIALSRQQGIQLFGTRTTLQGQDHLLQKCLTVLYAVLCSLEKGESLPDKEEAHQTSLLKATETNQLSFQVTLMLESVKLLMFRDMETALKHANNFFEIFSTKALPMRVATLYNVLYEALIAFYFMRRTGNKEYQQRGKNALIQLKKWSVHSKWNFKNKLLLAEAEFHNAFGDFDRAASCYEASVEAARKHRFIHEEALASELAGMFFYERGNHPMAQEFFIRSIGCYKKWGAHAVARRVENSIPDKLWPIDIVPDMSAKQFLSNKRQLNG